MEIETKFCPECGSENIVRIGSHVNINTSVLTLQYTCLNCNLKFEVVYKIEDNFKLEYTYTNFIMEEL